jgi:hypothetical protein
MGFDSLVAIVGLGIGLVDVTVHYLFPNCPRWVWWTIFLIGMGLFLIGCVFLTYHFFSNYRIQIVKSGDVTVDDRWLFTIPLIVVFATTVVGVVHFMGGRMIEIVSPESGTKVSWPETISGLVLPRDSFVQVFVLSNDHQWWPIEARTEGGAWYLKDNIGDQNVTPGSRYKLVAVSGARKFSSPVPRKPRGEARSRTIVVYRK